MQTQGHTKIMGIGGYVPGQVVKSEDLLAEIRATERFGIRESFLSDVLGIDERRIAADDENPSDLAIKASEIAIQNAGLQAAEIDLIIFCGIDRDWQEPSTAHRVQQVLGARNATCFDVTNACHGFMNGISIADAMIACGSAQTALICTGEKPSYVLYDALGKLQRSSTREELLQWVGGLTVGDAGGAMIIRKSDADQGFLKFMMQSTGELAELCYYKHTPDGIEGQMKMSEISDCMITQHKAMISNTYNSLFWKSEEVDHLVCHQVGKRPHKKMAKLANINIEKAPVTYKKYGNITSATIPVNLYFSRPKSGNKVLIMGAGSGMSISQTGVIF